MGEAVTDKRLTTIILDALLKDMYSTFKTQSIRDPDLGLEEIIDIMKTIFINHSERTSAPRRSQESYRKVWNSGREPRVDNVRESAMTHTLHNCKNPRHKKKDCKELIGKVG